MPNQQRMQTAKKKQTRLNINWREEIFTLCSVWIDILKMVLDRSMTTRLNDNGHWHRIVQSNGLKRSDKIGILFFFSLDECSKFIYCDSSLAMLNVRRHVGTRSKHVCRCASDLKTLRMKFTFFCVCVCVISFESYFLHFHNKPC